MYVILSYIISLANYDCYSILTNKFIEKDIISTYTTCKENQKLYGMWKEHYTDTKKPRVFGKFINNSKYGPWVWMFESGGVNTLGWYDDDKEHGNWAFFYDNGVPIMHGKMCNGLNCGKWVGYYRDGTIRFSTSWARGKLCGKYINYHDNGRISVIGFMQSGKMIGRWAYFDANGDVTIIMHGAPYDPTECATKSKL